MRYFFIKELTPCKRMPINKAIYFTYLVCLEDKVGTKSVSVVPSNLINLIISNMPKSKFAFPAHSYLRAIFYWQ